MDKYKLLKFHMNCNPSYLFGHAIVAGKLATRGAINTYVEYVSECKTQGITHYNEETFNQFMADCNRTIPSESIKESV